MALHPVQLCVLLFMSKGAGQLDTHVGDDVLYKYVPFTQLVQKVVLPRHALQGEVQSKQVRSIGTVPLGQLLAMTHVLLRTSEKK